MDINFATQIGMQQEIYKILRSEKDADGILNVDIRLNPDHKIYEGHFKSHKIVPGVLILKILKDILVSEVKNKLLLTESKNIKFIALIEPEKDPQLRISILYKTIDETLTVSAEIRNDQVLFIKFQGNYKTLND
ncbi:MAG: hypothetical protein H6605_08260 [Flavobacteriales bacterium]|nr:hypothetical protein [Flavobacteriales bacterium]